MVTIEELEKDPEFADLTYQEQVQLRGKWANKYLPTIAEFNELSQQEKILLLEKAMFRPPVTRNPKFGKRAAAVGKIYQEDPDRAAPWMQMRIASDAAFDQFSLARALGAITGHLGKAFGVQGSSDFLDEMFSPDMKKELEYYRHLLSGDNRRLANMRLLSAVSSLLAGAIDTVAYYAFLGGTVQAPKLLAKYAINKAQSLMTVIEKAPRLVNWARTSALPNVIHGVAAGGLVGAIREPVLRSLDSMKEKPAFLDLLSSAAKGFGSYAAGDVAFFVVASPLSLSSRMIKKVFRRIPSRSLFKQQELEELMEGIVSGKGIPEPLLARLHPDVRAQLRSVTEKVDLMKRISELSVGSDAHMQAAAFTKGWLLDKGEDGLWVASRPSQQIFGINVGSDDNARLFTLAQLVDPGELITAETHNEARQILRQVKESGSYTPMPGCQLQASTYGASKRRVFPKKGYTVLQNDIRKWILKEKAVTGLPETYTATGLTTTGNESSTYLISRAYYERAKVEPDLAKRFDGASFHDFRKVVEDASKEAWFGAAAFKTFDQTPLDLAWWAYNPDATRFNAYMNYLAPENINGVWDAAFAEVEMMPGREALSEVKKLTGLTTEQVRKMVNTDASIRPSWSIRYAVTPEEKAKLLRRKGGDFIDGYILLREEDFPQIFNMTQEQYLAKMAKGETPKAVHSPSYIDAAKHFVPASLMPMDKVPPGAAYCVIRKPKKVVPDSALNLPPESTGIGRVKAFSDKRYQLIAAGIEATVRDDGTMVLLHPMQQVKLVADVDPSTTVLGVTRTISSGSEFAAQAAMRNNYKISQMVTGQIPMESQSRLRTIAQAINPKDGRIDAKRIELASRLYMEEVFGIPRDKVIIKVQEAVRELPDLSALRARALYSNGQILITIPKKLNTPAAQKGFTHDLFHELAHAAQQYAETHEGFKLRKITTIKGNSDLGQRLLRKELATAEVEAEISSYRAWNRIRAMAEFSPEWADYAIHKQTGGQGALVKGADGYTIQRPEKAPVTYRNLEDVIENILVYDMDIPTIHASLKGQGYVLREVRSGSKAWDRLTDVLAREGRDIESSPVWYQLQAYGGRGPRIHYVDNSLPKLLRKVDWHPSLSEYLGPELAVVDDAKNGIVTYKAGVAVGNYQDLVHHFKNFKSKAQDLSKVIKIDENGYIMMHPESTRVWYEVSLPGVQFSKPFNDTESALHYLRGGFRTVDALEEMAIKKGYMLSPSDTGWTLWSGKSGASYSAKSTEELMGLLGSVPEIDFAPEMLGDYRFYEKMGPPPEGTFRPIIFDYSSNAKKAHPLDNISHWWRPADAYFESMMKHGGSPDALSAFRGVETAIQGAQADLYQTEKAIYSLFQDPAKPGKMIPLDRRKVIFWYMDNSTPNKEAYAAFNKMTPHEIDIAMRSRRLLEVLFDKFNVPREMWIPDYISHLRQNLQKDLRVVRGTMKDVFSRMNTPASIKEFFKIARTDDLAMFLMRDDLLEVLLKYNSIGTRALHLNVPLKELDAVIETLAKGGTEKSALVWRLAQYKDSILGIHAPNEEFIQQALIDFGQKVGAKDPSTWRNLYNAFYSMSYLATMGWRPFSAVRNVLQIWTTLAPRFGNANVVRAQELFLKNVDATLEAMKISGLITEEIPVYGSELMDFDGRFSRMVHSGLKRFQYADNLTRGVAWWTAKVQWDDAMRNFQASALKKVDPLTATEAFLEISGLNLVAPDVREAAKGLIREKKWTAAFDLYAKEVIDTTMFNYHAALRPTSFKGLVGRMFGMYGVYPAWYVENVKRGFRYGTSAQKAAFAARFLGNSAALFGAFTVLGLRAKDFLPWVPAQFTGGSYYQMANKLLMAFGNDYAARQARGELKKEIPRTFVPGSLAFRNLMRALASANEGRAWDTWTNLTSAGTYDD